MVSLWGTKNGGEDHIDGDDAGTPDGDESRSTRQPDHRGADERTQLLPPRNDGFLDPDDPAVSALSPLI